MTQMISASASPLPQIAPAVPARPSSSKPSLPSPRRASRAGSVKDVPGHFVKDVMRLNKTAKGEAAKSGGGAEVGQPHLIEASQKPKLAHHNITNKFRLPGRGTMVRRVSTGKPGGTNLEALLPDCSSFVH